MGKLLGVTQVESVVYPVVPLTSLCMGLQNWFTSASNINLDSPTAVSRISDGFVNVKCVKILLMPVTDCLHRACWKAGLEVRYVLCLGIPSL